MYFDLDIQDNGSEMGKELETTAKTFLGGVQIVRTRNQNIPDVSKLLELLPKSILLCYLMATGHLFIYIFFLLLHIYQGWLLLR